MYISLKNDFYKEVFDTICEKLESGEEVEVGASCIGHTRAQMTETIYHNKLCQKYGDRLIVNENWDKYRLKAE